ncbi:MAG: hypothetical protein V1659_01090 [Candidatus Woesearchaeota archaeon]
MGKIFLLFPKKRHGQAWSTDLIIATIIFVLVIAVFYSLMTSQKSDAPDELEIEAKSLASKLDSSESPNAYSIIDNNEVDKELAEELYSADYDTLKKEFGVGNEFCIYMEDANGNLVPVGNRYSVGNDDEEVLVGEIPCGEVVGVSK